MNEVEDCAVRRKILAGNWKMNKTISEMSGYFSAFNDELAKGSSGKNAPVTFI